MHARSTRTDRSPRRAAATTLIGLCNCLAKHCGKRPVPICLFASNRFLNTDSRRPDSAVQETAERVRVHTCASERLGRYVTRVCALCVYGSFKGSVCGGLSFHRMSAVVQLRCTAWPYIWNTEKIHQWYLLPPSLGPSFIGLCASVYFGWTCVWVRNCECAHV